MSINNNLCRSCGGTVEHTFCDLGMSPLSNAFLTADRREGLEVFYPLHARVCSDCLLVQLPSFETPVNIFGDYAYFSSYSESWLAHCKSYAANVISRFQLGAESLVVEIASNDGYLLQYFKAAGIPVLGIEPAANVAEAARCRGIETIVRFFGTELAQDEVLQDRRADLLIANNVLAHVPDLHDFVAGLSLAMKPHAILTVEFPHLLQLMQGRQFDTIYHEHFSYFSFLSAKRVFERHGLVVFDVEQVPTHGGSLRLYAQLAASGRQHIGPSVEALLAEEERCGLGALTTYTVFDEQARSVKRDLLEFLIEVKRNGRSVAGYGAPAKGNTLLNYCGIRSDFLDYTVDLNPVKQGCFLPGTHIPVYGPDKLRDTRPDYVLILPWNLKSEIIRQTAFVREWGGRFVVPIPRLTVIE